MRVSWREAGTGTGWGPYRLVRGASEVKLQVGFDAGAQERGPGNGRERAEGHEKRVARASAKGADASQRMARARRLVRRDWTSTAKAGGKVGRASARFRDRESAWLTTRLARKVPVLASESG